MTNIKLKLPVQAAKSNIVGKVIFVTSVVLTILVGTSVAISAFYGDESFYQRGKSQAILIARMQQSATLSDAHQYIYSEISNCLGLFSGEVECIDKAQLAAFKKGPDFYQRAVSAMRDMKLVN